MLKYSLINDYLIGRNMEFCFSLFHVVFVQFICFQEPEILFQYLFLETIEL